MVGEITYSLFRIDVGTMSLRFMDLKLNEAIASLKAGKINVCVIGLEGVGLPIACLLANAGVKVTGFDGNLKLLSMLTSSKPPIAEPGLEKLFVKALREKKLTLTSKLKETASKTQVFIFTVSASASSTRRIDYSQLEKLSSDVGLKLNPGSLLMFGGAMPPGLTEYLARHVLEERSGFTAGEDFGVAYSPLEASSGRIIAELTETPRLIAGINPRSIEAAEAVLSVFARGGFIRLSSLRAAEASALLVSIYRDVNIALANELALFCRQLDVDYGEVLKAANSQPRCHLHHPGIVGGERLHTRPYMLLRKAEDLGLEVRLAAVARKINEQMVKHTVKLVSRLLREKGKRLSGSKILLLGASYKADVKSSQLSPAKLLSMALKRKGAVVQVWDPLYSLDELRSLGYTPAILWETLPKVDCVIITVGHKAFRELKHRILRELKLRGGGIIFDCSGQGIFSAEDSTEKVLVSGLSFKGGS